MNKFYLIFLTFIVVFQLQSQIDYTAVDTNKYHDYCVQIKQLVKKNEISNALKIENKRANKFRKKFPIIVKNGFDTGRIDSCRSTLHSYFLNAAIFEQNWDIKKRFMQFEQSLIIYKQPGDCGCGLAFCLRYKDVGNYDLYSILQYSTFDSGNMQKAINRYLDLFKLERNDPDNIFSFYKYKLNINFYNQDLRASMDSFVRYCKITYSKFNQNYPKYEQPYYVQQFIPALEVAFIKWNNNYLEQKTISKPKR